MLKFSWAFGAVMSAASSALALGCQSAQPDRGSSAPAPGDSLALERTVCFGFCPAYRVRLARDGNVHFESRDPRATVRTGNARVTPEAVAALLERAAGLGLDSLPAQLMGKEPFCRMVATDHPSAMITWYRPQGSVQVNDYLGCFVHNDQSGRRVLERLRAFELAIDSVAGVTRWIRTPARN